LESGSKSGCGVTAHDTGLTTVPLQETLVDAADAPGGNAVKSALSGMAYL